MTEEADGLGSPAVTTFAHEYMGYIRRTYMGGQFGDAGNYAWNFYDQMEDPHKTNNNAEGGNNR